MAVMEAFQSMAAMGVPSLVPQLMNLVVKSSRWGNVPLLVSQDKADAAWESAQQHLDASHGWNPISDAANVYDAGKETVIALYDEGRAGAAFVAWATLEVAAFGLQMASDAASAAAKVAAELAKGAAEGAVIAGRVADVAERTAQVMAAYAAQEEALAARYQGEAVSLAAAYARQVAAEIAAAARAAAQAAARAAARLRAAARRAARVAARAAVVVAKAAYKYSGAQDVVSCVTDPTLSSCAKAAVTVALVAATGGEGEIEIAAADAAEDAGTAAAEDAGESAAADTGGDAADSCTVGGESFTAGTRVLLASGAAAAISQLNPGEKVLATNTKTGKTQAETITAVLVHHDTDLYDLTVKTAHGTAVIGTTANHLFWNPYHHYWISANKLSKNEHLKSANGAVAVVVGGTTPKQRDGWMWDLTVPGNNDHDFYVVTGDTPVLVHNSGGMDGCSDAAYQAVLHNAQEVVDGQVNHRIPGMDSTTSEGADALANHLDQIYSTPGTPLLNGTGEAWYDSERGLYIYRGNGAAPSGSVFRAPSSYFTNKTGVVLGQ